MHSRGKAVFWSPLNFVTLKLLYWGKEKILIKFVTLLSNAFYSVSKPEYYFILFDNYYSIFLTASLPGVLVKGHSELGSLKGITFGFIILSILF